ncbi:hypothetical protein [Arenibacter latericius]|uniref:hypothetical protein n=1 Tax=Arenibacter latericius TaxID=86104 RepID=UPI0004283210|nr:hypothetical protein [Arenibacter latericius]MDX1364583.1 hypothetical protein [Arenibacter latericius]
MNSEMKNLVFATALAVGSLSPMLANPPIFHDGIMEMIHAQDFTEIEKDKLPDAITAALEKDYPGATVEKAYLNDVNEYKLEVIFDDDSSEELFIHADGSWIEI